ncbi:MAG: hypothetical protein CSA83_02270 [Actinomycetales bacterium]|nr:MAG: hypothetical protein CSA83_02270 [Actinomycetales bacterium]
MTLANCDQNHVAFATVEGLLNLMRFALDSLRELGVPVERVLLIGGGAKSVAVQQLAAKVLAAKVEIPNPGEYVALGAAVQAGKVIATEIPLRKE